MRRRRPTVSQKLAALKQGRELPVDLTLMRPGDYADTDERAVLDLARAYQRAEDPDNVVTSWANQERAMSYFAEHGLVATIDEIIRLGGEG